MRNFSTVSKQKLTQTLLPHGYKNWKSVLYKLEDDICIFVRAKGEFSRMGSAIFTYIDLFPYCINLIMDEEEFDPKEPGFDMYYMLQRLNPIKFTQEYYIDNVVRASSEEGILRNLDSICEILEDYIVPYVQKLVDLEYYYSEYPILLELRGDKNPYAREDMFGVSVKLHKYDNAMIYLDRMTEMHKKSIDYAKSELSELRAGTISESLAIVEKRNPDIVEAKKRSAERAIIYREEEIRKIQVMEEALRSNNHEYLEKYINETEAGNREFLRKMLGC